MESQHRIRSPWLLLSLMIMVFASQFAKASSDSGTLTPGTLTNSCPPRFPGILTFIGFSGQSVDAFGTYGPTRLTGGKTVIEIYDETTDCAGVANLSSFNVTGFSSDPGSTWLSSITCGGVQKLQSSASYSYTSAAGTAFWIWSSKFGLSNGAQVSCTIVHS
jgi:hypothetical protein